MNSTQQPEASSTSPSKTSIQEKVKEATLEHNVQQSKATNWLGWMASILQSEEAEEQRENRRAESEYVRAQLWGAKPQSAAESDDVRKYVMGDNSETVHNHPRASVLGKIALALGIGGPLAAGLVMAPEIIKAVKSEKVVETPGATVVEPGTDADWRLLEPIVEKDKVE